MQNVNGNQLKKNITTKKCRICQKPSMLSRRLCLYCAMREQQQKEKERRAKKKEREALRKLKRKEKRENNTRLLKKKLDSVFSIWIRKKSADKNGKIVCVCCGAMLDWQEAQNMHYVSRSNYTLRYDERNCKAGCMRCNVFLHGNYPAYTEYLLNTYGEEWLKKLIADGRQIKKWEASELKELIARYTVDN